MGKNIGIVTDSNSGITQKQGDSWESKGGTTYNVGDGLGRDWRAFYRSICCKGIYYE